MSPTDPILLEIEDLRIGFPGPNGWLEPVRGLSMCLDRGEVVGLVGESGSGKTVTALSILGLLPESGRALGGKILFDGIDLELLEESRRRLYRGARIGFVFQEPEMALNPVFSIGYLLSETLRQHRPTLTRRQIPKEATRLLDLVAMPDPSDRLSSYPHQLSGGQRQRVMIALALAGSPDLLVADEPTTALDVSLQLQILDLLLELRDRLGLAILLITHDLAVVRSICERVVVMYAGQVVESGTILQVFEDPKHPYTQGLLAAMPRLGDRVARGELPCIPGSIPELGDRPAGCTFHPRCSQALATCTCEPPELVVDDQGREIRCVLAEPSS